MTVPTEWNLGILCPVHKKGDALNCETTEELVLLCIAYKVFSNILLKHLLPIVDSKIEITNASLEREEEQLIKFSH
ncbi:hypothetical protein CEXT_468401 [Caerostris extrusa]|uniref:Uncharacterized protein n=1 Tax=Caerostris extrusa TaxID=172846 RepID=A0AAV4RQQ9_CAEEX|nr:hypothetical protein CEXT_468401 [Caerostris extrusa]